MRMRQLCTGKVSKKILCYKAGEERSGFESEQTDLTLLMVGYAFGDCKLKPMLIYNAKTPRAMKNIHEENLPVHWYHNKKG